MAEFSNADAIGAAIAAAINPEAKAEPRAGKKNSQYWLNVGKENGSGVFIAPFQNTALDDYESRFGGREGAALVKTLQRIAKALKPGEFVDIPLVTRLYCKDEGQPAEGAFAEDALFAELTITTTTRS